MYSITESFQDILYYKSMLKTIISKYTYKYYISIFNTPILKELIKNE